MERVSVTIKLTPAQFDLVRDQLTKRRDSLDKTLRGNNPEAPIGMGQLNPKQKSELRTEMMLIVDLLKDLQ